MLRDAALSRVKVMLGFKQNLDADILQAMVETQEDLERSSELPYFLRKNYLDWETEEGVRNLTVPTDFIREWDDDQLFAINDELMETPIVKDQEGFLRLRWPIQLGWGTPKKYARVYKDIHLYPTPDKIYTLNGAYYAKDLPLTTNIENKWLKELPYILIARAGLMLAAGLRDKDGMSAFSSLNEIMTAKLHQMTVADDAAGSRPIIGGDED